ncbi:hypothetical protein BKA70DRAFT_1229760 [Coprinopsis sp. MPI-PUGE-AT-0042]|nr:hypothetical protein BKA70DRAFT_1229760 [Coprinopsis sp. MPI-PUGE-AT-0042]
MSLSEEDEQMARKMNLHPVKHGQRRLSQPLAFLRVPPRKPTTPPLPPPPFVSATNITASWETDFCTASGIAEAFDTEPNLVNLHLRHISPFHTRGQQQTLRLIEQSLLASTIAQRHEAEKLHTMARGSGPRTSNVRIQAGNMRWCPEINRDTGIACLGLRSLNRTLDLIITNGIDAAKQNFAVIDWSKASAIRALSKGRYSSQSVGVLDQFFSPASKMGDGLKKNSQDIERRTLVDCAGDEVQGAVVFPTLPVHFRGSHHANDVLVVQARAKGVYVRLRAMSAPKTRLTEGVICWQRQIGDCAVPGVGASYFEVSGPSTKFIEGSS